MEDKVYAPRSESATITIWRARFGEEKPTRYKAQVPPPTESNSRQRRRWLARRGLLNKGLLDD
jgi:hypothetical protein